MSNKRRPQRRDAHGAPVRTTREIQIAVATVLGVLAVTVLLLVVFRNQPASSSPAVPNTSASTQPTGGSTTSTAPPINSSSSSTPAPSSSSAAPSSSTTSSTAPTVSTTKP